MNCSNTERQSGISTTCSAWVLLFLYEMSYNHTSNSKKSTILRTNNTKTAKDLIENEVKLQNITFNIFKNFKEIYCKKCCKPTTKNQGCCNLITFCCN